MHSDYKRRRKPAIVLSSSDYDRLAELADRVFSKTPSVAEQLLSELDRARIVDDGRLPATVVGIGSTVRFTTDAGEDRTVTLVFPGEADIDKGKVSILTPIGTALIGLRSGQSISWTARDDRSHLLTVQSVEPNRQSSKSEAAAQVGPHA